MDYFHAQRLASRHNVPAEVIEKDFLIELLLFNLGQDLFFNNQVIFRGGTALKKAYFPDYRFSEDLDFLMRPGERPEVLRSIVFKRVDLINADYPYGISIISESLKEGRMQLFLGYDIIPEIRSTKNFKIDISQDDVIPSFHIKKMLLAHQEFQAKDIELLTYDLESVASDKICRISEGDNEPRDLYDLWYLLKLDINTRIVKSELKRRFGFNYYLPNLPAEIKKEDFKKNWERRLKVQIANLPPYEDVIKELEDLIVKKLLRKK